MLGVIKVNRCGIHVSDMLDDIDLLAKRLSGEREGDKGTECSSLIRGGGGEAEEELCMEVATVLVFW